MTNKRDKGAPEQEVSLDDASISKIAGEIRRRDRKLHTRRNLMDVLSFLCVSVFFGIVLV